MVVSSHWAKTRLGNNIKSTNNGTFSKFTRIFPPPRIVRFCVFLYMKFRKYTRKFYEMLNPGCPKSRTYARLRSRTGILAQIWNKIGFLGQVVSQNIVSICFDVKEVTGSTDQESGVVQLHNCTIIELN